MVAFVDVDGWRLEYELIPACRSDLPTLVFLHEALGSVALWRDFPARVAAATGCRTLIWSRLGHGRSAPLPAPRTPRYLHAEALERLPPLLAALSIERPVLIGHSDGGSIALIHAAALPDRVAGVVVMAPHEFVEEKALAGIRLAGESYAHSDWPQKLARYHRDPDAVFRAWHDTWLAPEFRAWSITGCLPGCAAPFWPSRAKTTSTRRCPRSSALPKPLRMSNCSGWQPAVIRRTATSRWRSSRQSSVFSDGLTAARGADAGRLPCREHGALRSAEPQRATSREAGSCR